MNAKYAIDIIESERSWGQRLDETVYRDSKEEAEAYVKKYNAPNSSAAVPDWYSFAVLRGLVELDENGKEV